MRILGISINTHLAKPAFIFLSAAALAAGQGTITTVAGNGATMYSGDGGPALTAALNHPRGMAVGGNGFVYINDVDNLRVRAIDSTGRIFSVAGTGLNMESGDGGMASAASISDAMSLAVDGAGNIYIGDSSNRRIRKITPAGVITTIAGTGVEGFSGDGGPAAQAMLGRPVGLALDSAGNLFIADSTANRIRKIDASGTISTIAGNGIPGFSGDGGPAINASIKTPTGVTVDSAGNVYFADADNNRIRKITPAGIISTVAGTGGGGFTGDGGLATAATLNIPYDVVADGAGNLFIADAGNNRIRKVSGGIMSTVSGTGATSFTGDGGPASQAALNFPWGVSIDAAGNLYVADRVNSRVRKIANLAVGVGVPNVPTIGTPAVQQGGIMNGASFSQTLPIAPGALVALFGTDLSSSAIPAPSVPLPTTLGDTTVTFNGVAAPLYYVSPKQINVQAPVDLPVGTATIQVKRGNLVSATQIVNVGTVSPGLFILDPVANTGIVLHSDFTLVTSASPARPGETVVVYATGLGPVEVPIKSGFGGPTTAPFGDTTITPVVNMGGLGSTVLYSGLAPSFVGVYQVNFTVPPATQSGNQFLQIVTNGTLSNIVSVPVGR